MADANSNSANDPQPQGFPFFTAILAGAVLFVFLGLMWFAAQSANPLAAPPDTKAEPKADPPPSLDEVKARNQAALDGVGAKMSLREAHGKLLGTLKGPNDTLPFPTPEPPVVAAPVTKKDDTKSEGKKP